MLQPAAAYLMLQPVYLAADVRGREAIHACAWSCACTSAVPPRALLSLQALANTAYAYARMGYAQRPLLAAISAQASKRLAELNPQNVSNIIWALATLEQPVDRHFLEQVSEVLLLHLPDFSTQNISNLLW